MPEQMNSSSRLSLGAEHLGDLLAAVLDAVAEADGIDLAVFDRRPGVHRHRVGVVQEARAALRDLADVPAEIEDDRDVALAVENAAGADRVADALVDAVFQRDADVVGVRLEAADAHAADDVVRAFQRLPAVGGRGDRGRQAVGLDHRGRASAGSSTRLCSLMSVSANSASCSSGTRDDVGDQPLGEADAAGADDGDLQLVHATSRQHSRQASAPGAPDGNPGPTCCLRRIPPSAGRLRHLRRFAMRRVKFALTPDSLCSSYRLECRTCGCRENLCFYG